MTFWMKARWRSISAFGNIDGVAQEELTAVFVVVEQAPAGQIVARLSFEERCFHKGGALFDSFLVCLFNL